MQEQDEHPPRSAAVGKTVDVCLGRNAAPGNSTGSLLGSESINLIADDDLTLVGTKSVDKVILWDNMLPPAPIGPAIYWYAICHAADVGSVVFARESDVVVSVLPHAFVKGEEDRSTSINSSSFWLTATRLDQAVPMAQGHFQVVEGRRLEIILVGSKSSNARFVAVYRSKLAP